MKPVFQTIFTPPLGNCLQACIASLLELSLDAVPNFMELPDEEWPGSYYAWMISRHQLQPLCLTFGQEGWAPAGYYLLQGKSPRGDFDHVVVAFGNEIVHDPYPEQTDGLRTREFMTVFVSTMRGG